MRCVRSKPKGIHSSIGVTDSTGTLEASYQKTVGDGAEPYTPVYVELKVRDQGKATDGFALDYDGVYQIEEIVAIKPME